jgi:phage baseplate assembly protein W
MAERFDLAYPYRIDSTASTAGTDYDTHIRDLIEQVLFTSPGERVNLPDFGSGLGALVFEPNSDALASSLQLAVQGNLQRWLADRIEIEKVEVVNDDAILRVTVAYRVRRTGIRHEATFEETI